MKRISLTAMLAVAAIGVLSFSVGLPAAMAFAAGVSSFTAGLTGHDVATGLLLANAPLALPELKILIDGIQKGFSDFKELNDRRYEELKAGKTTGDSDAKLAKLQGELTELMSLKGEVEKLEAKTNRISLGGGGGNNGNQDDLNHKTAFVDGFVRKGADTGLIELEKKSWSVVVSADGGFGLPKVIETEIEKMLRDVSPMRQLARVVQIGTSDYNRLVNKNGISSGWVGEKSTRPETNTSAFDNFKPSMGELYATPWSPSSRWMT